MLSTIGIARIENNHAIGKTKREREGEWVQANKACTFAFNARLVIACLFLQSNLDNNNNHRTMEICIRSVESISTKSNPNTRNNLWIAQTMRLTTIASLSCWCELHTEINKCACFSLKFVCFVETKWTTSGRSRESTTVKCNYRCHFVSAFSREYSFNYSMQFVLASSSSYIRKIAIWLFWCVEKKVRNKLKNRLVMTSKEI